MTRSKATTPRFPRSRQRILIYAAAGIATALALSGCGGSTDQSEGSNGGTLRVATQLDVTATDNLQVDDANDRMIMGSTVFEPLFVSDENAVTVPALAVSAEPVDDTNLAWTIALREGVKFHNGSDFTADDVKANFDAFLDEDNAAPSAGDIANIDSVEVVDDYTVRMNLKAPQGDLPAIITNQIFIGDMDARAEMGEQEWAQHPIGTGPFKWSDRLPGETVTFDRFDDYWRGKPLLERVVFQVIPNGQVAAVALQRGEVDVVPAYIEPTSIPAIKADPAFQVLERQGDMWYLAFTNSEKGKRGGYDDHPLEARKGIAYLMNAQEIVPPIVGDAAVYAPQQIPDYLPDGHDPDLEPYPYDPDEGIRLLTMAGYPPGSTLQFIARDAPYTCDWATATASAFTELGYNIDLQCVDDGTADALTQDYDTWDLVFTRNGGKGSIQSSLRSRWAASNGAALNDYYTTQDPELDQLTAELVATDDPEKVRELAYRVADVVIREQVVAIGGYHEIIKWAASAKVKGLKPTPQATNPFLYNGFTQVSIEEPAG